MKKRNALRWLAAGSLALGASFGLSACKDGEPAAAPAAASFKSVDMTGADYARDFKLKDQNGQVRTMADFRGKVVAVFFGFTQCPDVCPTSLAELAEVKRQLGADGDKLQVVFVTVDPERDRPEVLKTYLANFDPTFLALVPTADELATMAKDYKVYYKRVDGRTPGSYTMDHSAASYLYDTHGALRLYARYNSGVPAMVSDIRALLQQA